MLAVQDGAVCLFDMRSRQRTHRLPLSAEDVAVPSVTFSPLDSHTLYCCAEEAVLTLDLRRVRPKCAPNPLPSLECMVQTG